MHFTESKYEPMMSDSLRYRPPGRCFVQNTGGVAAMTIEELLKRLHEFHGISVDKKTPYNYAKYGWIPTTKVINKGRAGGKMIDYEESASVEFVASRRLKREKKASTEEVAMARKYALSNELPPAIGAGKIERIIELSIDWDAMLERAKETEDPRRREYNILKKRLYDEGPREKVRRLFYEASLLIAEHQRQMDELWPLDRQNLSTQDFEAIIAKMNRATDEFTARHDSITAQIKAIFNETEARALGAVYGSEE